MKPGIYEDLPAEEYHASDAVSRSGLTQIERSIDHYREYVANGIGDSKALRTGTAIHTAILEPERFQHEYIDAQIPDECGGMYQGYKTTAELVSQGLDAEKIAKRTKTKLKTIEKHLERDDVMALIDHYEKFPPGSTPEIEPDELDTALRCRDAVAEHPTASQILTDGSPEMSHFWEDTETGILCKCRPDWQRSDGILVDVKSASDATPEAFQRSLHRYQYYVQAPFYLDGVSATTGSDYEKFLFIVVETGSVPGVRIYDLDDYAIERGRDDYRRYLDELHKAQTVEDYWTGYPTEIESISLPKWA